MSFKFLCPACHGSNYRIAYQRKTGWVRPGSFKLVFRCPCGMRLFDEQVARTHDSQLLDYQERMARGLVDTDPNSWRETEAGETVEEEPLPSKHPERCPWDPPPSVAAAACAKHGVVLRWKARFRMRTHVV